MSSVNDLFANALEVIIEPGGSYASPALDNAGNTSPTVAGAPPAEVDGSAPEPAGVPYSNQRSAWWVYRPTVSGQATFFTGRSSDPANLTGPADTQLAIYRQGAPQANLFHGLTYVAGDQDSGSAHGGRQYTSRATAQVEAGATYFIQVGVYGSSGPRLTYVLDVTGPTTDTSVWRYYFRNGTPATVSPVLDGTYWDTVSSTAGGTVAHQLVTVPAGAAGSVLPFSHAGDTAAVRRRLSRPFNATVPRGGTLSGTFRLVVAGRQQKAADDAHLTCRIRVLSADGAAVRGILYAGAATGIEFTQNTTSHTTATTRTLAANLAPVAGVLPTDLLQVEVGLVKAGTDNGATYTYLGDDATLPDYDPAVNALWTTGRPWIELVLDDPPPAPPANLRQTSATLSTIDVAWDADLTGGPVAGYAYRLDGGPVVDVGNVTTARLDGLTMAATYLLEVRAYGAGALTSAWVPLEVATVVPDANGLRLEVGPEGDTVDLLGPAYSLTIRRGNASRGVTDTLEAATLVAVIDGLSANPLLVPQVRTGNRVRVLAGLGGEWEPIYTGELDRARLVYATGPDKADPDAYRVTLTATDPATPVLAGHPHGTAVGGTLAQRVGHVLDPTGLAYAVTDPSPPTATPALPTGEKTAGGNLRLAVDTAHAIAYVDRAGVLRVVSDHARPRTAAGAAADYLLTDDPDAPDAALHYYDVTPSLDTDALVNVLEVDLEGAGTSVHVEPSSLAEWGPHADTVKVNDGLPETHADLWLASRRDPALVPEAVAFNVNARPSHLPAAIALEPYATVAVERAGVFEPAVKMAVRALTHTIRASKRDGVKWLTSLELRPLEVLATRWDDVPPGLRWSDLDPDMTWDDVVRWHPYL